MSKPKLAVAWNASCGGCDEAIVDIEEQILEVAGQVEFVLWPCAMDFKYDSVAALEDGAIAASLINGSIQNSEQEAVVKMLRQKSALVVAFGSCACFGGIPALANLTNKEAIFERSYLDSPTVDNPDKVTPQPTSEQDGFELHLPHFHPTVSRLQDIIAVDYFLPGCPPTRDLIVAALTALLSGDLPPVGSVLAPDSSLCASCPRNESKPDRVVVPNLQRIHQVVAEEDTCFLAQGILCMGPATRDGCGSLCIKGNMPCSGCFGPLGDMDQGAQMAATLGGLLPTAEGEADPLDGLPDPAGSFYRYSMGSSLLGRERAAGPTGKEHTHG